MKLTKQVEKEIRQVYKAFWDSLLNVDLKTFNALLDDDFRQIGTTVAEVFFNRKAAAKFLKATENQLAGNLELRNQQLTIEALENYVLITDLFDAYVKIDSSWTFYSRGRSTFLLHKTPDGWKFLQQHTSVPDLRTEEGETIGLEKISKENIELREAVKRRTIELEQKNRVLEIEASLEKVRTIALSMKEPADMLNVCHIISDQLKHLQIQDIRNVQTIIINESKFEYINYQYFTPYDKNSVEQIDYRLHPVELALAQKMLSSPDAFYSKIFQGKDLQVWRDHRKATHQLPDPLLDEVDAAYYYFYSIGSGGIGVTAYTRLTDEALSVFKQFRNVFKLAYRRYIDIELAHVQARDAQIEAALERLRSQSLAMQKSDELHKVIRVVATQISDIGIIYDAANFATVNDDGSWEMWVTTAAQNYYPIQIHVPYFDNPVMNEKRVFSKTEDDFSQSVLSFEEKNSFFNHFFENTVAKNTPEERKKFVLESKGLAISRFRTKSILLSIIKYDVIPYAHSDNEIFKRFTNVFKQAYTRFLDLQKAEAQVKEAQIELGLERVRAKAMAMQKSNELSELVDTVFKELTKLDFALNWCIINIIDESSLSNTVWAANPDINQAPESYHMLFEDYPFHDAMMKGWKERSTKYVYVLQGLEKKIYDDYLFNETEFKKVPKEAQAASRAMEKYVATFSFSNFGGLQTVGDVPLSDTNIDILSRFGKVFDLTYTRFNDLQKAEAQARESQIQLALERVRARTMAMEKSDELPEAAILLFQQVQSLGMPAWSAGYCIWDDDKNAITLYMSSEGVLQPPAKAPTTEDELFIQMRKGYEQGKALHVVEMGGKKLVKHYEYMRTLPVVGEILDSIIKAGHPLPTFQIMHQAYFSRGFLLFITYEPVPGSHNIFIRFANVFDQTYTRFLDLQKAEAQAREAKIEMALERVRSRSLAMHSSGELGEVVTVVLNNLLELGYLIDQGAAAHLAIFSEGTKDFFQWSADPALPHPVRSFIPYTDLPILTEFWDARQKGHNFFAKVYSFEEKNTWFNFAFEHSDLKHIPGELKKLLLESETYAHSVAIEKNSAILINSITGNQLSENQIDILRRFSKVFEQAYIRFLDLQKAEAQAREAQIELALERVRARTMAMQHSEELQDTSLILFEQLKELGEPAEQCTIGIIKESEGVVEISATLHGNKMHQTFRHKIDEPFVMTKMFKSWKDQQKTLILEIKEEELQKYNQYRNELVGKETFPVKLLPGDRWIIHIAYFSKGMLALSTNEPRPAESLQLLERFAIVFDQTYTRFLDLQKAEAQAREAQIEAALERVRSRSLAMHKSEELIEVDKIIIEQIKILNIHLFAVGIHICHEQEPVSEAWMGDPTEAGLFGGDRQFRKVIYEHTHDRLSELMYRGWKEGKTFLVETIQGEMLGEHIEYMKTVVPDPTIFENSDPPEFLIFHLAYFSQGFFVFVSTSPCLDEHTVFFRITKVFEQTYTRFLDLKKAEAQVKEAKIEAALERVRAQAMAMHHSEDLEKTIRVYFEQLDDLIDSTIVRCGAGLLNKENTVALMSTASKTPEGETYHVKGTIDMRGHPLLESTYEHWLQQKEHAYVLRGNEIKEYYQYVTNQVAIPENKNGDELYFYFPMFTEGSFYVVTNDEVPVDELQIFRRFSSVISLAYRRFNDLQKAEAQTREAQIELGLERVRARAMAMQNSNELADLVDTVFKELTKLHFLLDRCIIMINDPITNGCTWWLANPEPGAVPVGLFVKYHEHKPNLDYLAAWKDRTIQWEYVLEGKNKKEWDAFLFAETDLTLLPDFVKTGMRSFDKIYLNVSFNNFGNLTVSTSETLQADHFDILLRFAKVFDLTYTRFNDLQKAEAQTREAQIETSLERVRAKTMAMHSSEDVSTAIATLFTEMDRQSIENVRCGIAIISTNKTMEVWSVTNVEDAHLPALPDSTGGDEWVGRGKMVKAAGTLHMNAHKLWQLIYDDWKNKRGFLYYHLSGKEKQDYIDIINAAPGYLSQPILEMPDMHCQVYIFNEGAIWAYSLQPHTAQQRLVMNRFTAVFSQTFLRYRDLQNAEAQTREALIEASLERLRSKTMAMHNSQDVGETVATMFDQLVHLGVTTNRCGILIFNDTNNTEVWTAKSNPGGEALLIIGHLDVMIHPMLQGVHTAWKNREAFFSYEMDGDDLKNYYSAINNYPDYPTRFNLDNLPAKEIHSDFFFPDGAVFAFTSASLSTEDSSLFKRFAGVFGQTYRRYLDLQKAEAQSREAQIELGLERVRARAMAMQKSNELADAAQLLYHEFGNLGINTFSCGYMFIDEAIQTQTAWVVLPDGSLLPNFISFPLTGDHVLNSRYKEWKEMKPLHILELQGEANKAHHRFLSNYVPPFVVEDIFSKMPDRVIFNCANFSDGYLLILATENFSPEEQQTIIRFAKVFEQTYTRFLDLQKAEAQSREAQIELGLERVRARAMAMQKSEELSELVDTVFKELTKLHFALDRCIIIIVDEKSVSANYWMANPESRTPTFYHLKLKDIPYLIATFNAWKERKAKMVYDLNGDEKTSTVQYIFSKTDLKFLPAEVKEGMKNTNRIFLNASFNNFGGLQADTFEPLSEENLDILYRFAKVFDLTYTRFNDIKKAEAQTREAQIEAALERVRAKTMAMHKSEQLPETAQVLFEQFAELGKIPDRIAIGIIKEELQVIEWWATDQMGSQLARHFDASIFEPTIAQYFAAWKEGKDSIMVDLSGEALKEWVAFVRDVVKMPIDDSKMKGRRVHHGAFFSQGLLLISAHEPMLKETMLLLVRFAKVFSQTYTRFLDLQKAEAQAEIARLNLIQIQEEKQRAEIALTELQATQKQLIQSEKMASLGELTAGIAHEIQNPLNFVNNFSEVSTELVDEMNEEIDKGKEQLATGNMQLAIDKLQLAKEIANDLKQNLEKINHHGKRAGDIVKGMLQHSRSSSGVKETTNINALCDEYLRLSYHGLRAKEKSFNATMITDYDNSIGTINIIPQDIGRVILNLINNAFYAAPLPPQGGFSDPDYKHIPTVWVTTKKVGDKVFISVRDNGPGVPKKILDKIFQPFFTTKPTGQGTGLGLSLSYDIVKAHGGEIIVETKEGEGSEFIIQLPSA